MTRDEWWGEYDRLRAAAEDALSRVEKVSREYDEAVGANQEARSRFDDHVRRLHDLHEPSVIAEEE